VEQGQALPAVGRDGGLKTFFLQIQLQKLGDVAVVFHDEDFLHHSGTPPQSCICSYYNLGKTISVNKL
jgi:hypothetical protein